MMKMRTLLMLIFTLVMLLLFNNRPIAQEKLPRQSSCASSGKINSLVHLSFEKMIESEEPQVLLRLANYTICGIELGTQSAAVIVSPGSGVKVVPTTEIPDGARVAADFWVQEAGRGESRREYKPRGCIITTSLLPANRSVLFRVPLELLEGQKEIVVLYSFEGESPS